MLFSIIVPVYNVEKYLTDTINSVLKQDFKDFELILINDGSKDHSKEICLTYAKQDTRIKLIDKENEGVSIARNTGLKEARGEYILFLDSDDFLTDGLLAKLKTYIDNNPHFDLLIGNYNILLNEQVLSYENIKNFNLDDNQPAIIFMENIIKSKNDLPRSIWRCLYKREVIEKNEIIFNAKLSSAEDTDLLMHYFLASKRVSYVDIPFINYRIFREGSITSKVTFKNIYDQLVVYSKYYYIFRNEINNKIIYQYFANLFANAISSIHHLTNKEEIEKIKYEIYLLEDILKDTKGFKYKIAKIIWTIFGYHKGSKILSRR